MDLASISGLLTAVKTATDIAKFVRDSDLTIEKAEYKLKLADLINALAEVKMEVSQVQQELIEKDSEIRILKSKFEIHESLVWNDPLYWRQIGNEREGPYCQPCYDKDGRLVRLQSNGRGHWGCRVCTQGFMEPGARNNRPRRADIDYDPLERS